ncbi:MAG: caspase family protein [Saprospiraceae bacterium]
MLAHVIAKRLLLTLLFGCSCVPASVFAQVEDANSLNSRALLLESRNWELRDIVRTRDRQHLAAVGAVTNERGMTDGFFMLLDAETGAVVGEPKFFGGSRNDALNGVAETNDNTFCLVGSTTISAGEQSRAWVIHLGADLQIISEWKGHERRFAHIPSLERIAWPEGSPYGLVLAPLGDDGNAWLGRVGKGAPEQYFPEAGEGFLKNVVGLETSGGTGVWLIGSTKKAGKNRLNDPWARRFDAAKPEKSDAPIMRKTRGNVRAVTCAAIGPEGQVMMAGEVVPVSNKTNVFVREFAPENDESRDADPCFFGEQYDDTPLALCKAPDNKNFGTRWTLYRAGPNACYLNARETDDPRDEGRNLAVNLGPRFEATRFLRLGKNRYLVAGTCDGQKGRALRLYFFSEKEALVQSKPSRKMPAGKALANVEITQIRLEAPGGADCIPTGGANQQARIWVTLTNRNAETLTELMLTAALADGSKSHSGFDFRKMHGVDRVGPNESIEIPFWASADASVAPGATIRLNFRLTDEDGAELAKKPNHAIEVCDQKQTPPAPGGPPGDDLSVISPPRGQINKGLKTNTSEYVFEISTKTQQPLKPGETPGGKTAAASSERPRDQESTLLDSGPTTDGRHQGSYRITVRDLKPGENTIYFYLHGSTDVRDSVKITYEPVKPTLHVLAIAPAGPNYTGSLSFNDDDARDFAAAMERQKNGRWFGGVRVKTLLSPEETSRTNIEAAFAELLNDFNDRIIQPQDYLIVFMTGHGEHVNKEFYLLTSELFNRRAPKATALNFNYIFRDYLSLIGCKKIVFSDACHSAAGGLETEAGGKDHRDTALLEAQQMAAQFLSGSVSFYSSSSSQRSFEDSLYLNGIYTEALLEALAGKPVELRNHKMLDPDDGYFDPACPTANQADHCGRGDRLLSAGELEKFLEIRVPDLLWKKNPKLVQTPSFKPLGLPQHLTIFALP